MLDAAGQPARHLGNGILTVDADKVRERREQGCVRQHFRLDAVMQRLFPSIEDVSQSGLLLSVVLKRG